MKALPTDSSPPSACVGIVGLNPIFTLGLATALAGDRRLSVLVLDPPQASSAWSSVLAQSGVDVLVVAAGGHDQTSLLVTQLRRVCPHARVVVLVESGAPAGFRALVELGVSGLVDVGSPLEHLRAAVAAAMAGQDWVCPQIAMQMRSPTDGIVVALTPRESQVLTALSAGSTNDAIAGLLGVSTHTVANHVHSVLVKLGVGSRTEAVAVGWHRGLIRPPVD